MSVEFTPLEKWRGPYAGLYWGLVQAEYPKTEVQPALPSTIEKYGEEFWRPQEVRVEIVDPDVARYWFLTDPPNRLLQLQRNRFVVNWRKVQEQDVYPRYANDIRPRFQSEWHRFQKFVVDRAIGKIDVQQCEVTYVNDIPQGDGWETFDDSLKLFAPWWRSGTDGFLGSPETLSVSGSFLIPSERGRLHFASRHVRRKLDQKETVQLRLVVRGKPESSSDEDVLAWMDMAREWIVRGFADLTSADAHRLWQRTQ